MVISFIIIRLASDDLPAFFNDLGEYNGFFMPMMRAMMLMRQLLMI